MRGFAFLRPLSSGADRRMGAAVGGAGISQGAKNRHGLVWWAGGLFAALLLTAGAYWILMPAPIVVVHPRIGPAVTAVYASGTVESAIMFPVAPRVGARLVEINHDERSPVRKGELLGRLESSDLTNNIAQLEAQAAFAEADYGRYARLMRDHATTQQAFDRAVANRNTAVSAVRQARSQAGFMDLRAPGDCTVIERDGEVGQFIAANTPVFWLSCHAALRISAQVDEEDIPLVKPGQQVLIRADAFPGRTFRGRVDQLTPKGDPVGRSYRVRIGLPADSPLQIGMTTEANIVVRENLHALLLPAGAVLNDRVYRVTNGHVEQVQVVPGARGNDWIEVVRGISSNDLVVQNASATPADSRAFRIRLANP